MAYFLADGRTPSPAAPLLRAALQAGLIDSLHSWGDFNQQPPEPGFLRQLAQALTEQWQQAGLSVPVWINHGAPTNRQNFLTRMKPEFVGDEPRSPWYTADLARAMGIRFYWGMELTPWPLSLPRPWTVPAYWLRVGSNSIKNLIKFFLGCRRQCRRREQITSLAVPLELRDGWRVWACNRFNRHPQGLWGLPTRHTLRYALAPAVLAKLRREAGFLILYTHLGLPRPAGGPIFPAPDRQALEDLADNYHKGNIWVATTARLLTYWQVHHSLQWRTKAPGDHCVIELMTIADLENGRRRPTAAELAGLSFYVDRPGATKLVVGGQEVVTRSVPPDHTGRGGIMVPLAPPPATLCLEERWAA